MMLCPRCLRQFTAEEQLEFCPDDRSLLYQMPSELAPGFVIDERYEVEHPVGLGGWSIVYKGRHVHLNSPVAIKVLLPNLVRDAEKFKRFKLEAQVASALDHPNIVKVYDYGVLAKGTPFIVMDYLSGKDLSEVLDSASIPVGEVIEICRQICDGMEAAHRSGLVHRDLKPSNIIITSDSAAAKPQIKIVDFGVSKLLTDEYQPGNAPLTRTGDSLGTPHYMSPEQCLGQPVDARSDIYSLGCMMYEMLTSCKPFAGNSAFECMTNQVTASPLPFAQVNPALKLPAALEEVVFVALEKTPEARFQTMMDLGEHLRALDDKGNRSFASQINWRKSSVTRRREEWTVISVCAFAIFAFVFYQLARPLFAPNRLTGDRSATAEPAAKTGRLPDVVSRSAEPKTVPAPIDLPLASNSQSPDQNSLPQLDQDLSQGILLYNRGDFSTAIVHLSRATNGSQRGNATAHYYLANSFLRTGNKEAALREYESAKDLAPNGTIAAYATNAIRELSSSKVSLENVALPAVSVGDAAPSEPERTIALPPLPSYRHDEVQPSVTEVSGWSLKEKSQYLQIATDHKNDLEGRAQEANNVLSKARSLASSLVPRSRNYGESEAAFEIRQSRARMKSEALIKPYETVVAALKKDLDDANSIFQICLGASGSSQ